MASPPGEIGFAMDLLKGDFESNDQEIRLQAIKRISLVAEAIGPEDTRNELLPYLASISIDDDEVLLAIASQLGHFLPLVGGEEHAHLLLPINSSPNSLRNFLSQSLENLAFVEETVVRDMAVSSTCNILSKSGGYCADSSFEMLNRLAIGDWFSSQVSACGLLAAVYQANAANSDIQQKICSLYVTLAKDETPMVRRAAAHHTGDLASVASVQCLNDSIVKVLSTLAADDEDSVRMIAAEQLGKVAECMVKAKCEEEAYSELLPIFKKCTEHRSWRVRHSAAKCMPTLARALGTAVFARDLVAPLNALLQDIETEVRSQALKDIHLYVGSLGADAFVIEIMPSISALAQDVSLPVRIALSNACMSLAHQLGQDHAIKSILPMLKRFLKDEFPEVRMNILTKLEAVADIIPAVAEQLLPIITELGHDHIWRIRRAVVLSIPMIAEKLGIDYFEEKLLELYLQAYQDNVCDVRTAAGCGLKYICQVCGSDWIKEKVMTRLLAIYKSSNFYLHRITILHAIKTLLGEGSVAQPSLVSEVINVMLIGLDDPIPNVRFTAVKTLQEVAPFINDASLINQVQPRLTEIARIDADNDVKFFASQALIGMQ